MKHTVVGFRCILCLACTLFANLWCSDWCFFRLIQVLVVQASEAPNNLTSVVQSDPADASNNIASDALAIPSSRIAPEAIHEAREIVAYDDLF